MILYLLRHGTAEDSPAAGGGDGTRRLTERGRQKVRAAAAGMRALGLKFDVILTSPMARAAETAELVASSFPGAIRPEVLPALGTSVSPFKTCAALKSYDRYETLMIVGHEPGLSATTSVLLTGSADSLRLNLKKSGLVALEFADGIERAGARLCWMLTPRQLRRLGK